MKKINITYNYNQFKLFKGNRGINPLHVKRLIKSMQEKFLINPIYVNDKFQVIDGQHRLEACKATGNPVYYIIQEGWDIREAHRLNATQRNWSVEEYLNGYCDLGYEDYIKFRNFKHSNPGFGFSSLLSIASGYNSRTSQDLLSKFKDGCFIFKDPYSAQLRISKIKAVGKYYSGYTRMSFVFAMLYLFNRPNFDNDIFLSKLAYQSTKLVDCTSTQQYISIIEDIYNFKTREKQRFY